MVKTRQNLGSGDFTSKIDEVHRQAKRADQQLSYCIRDLNSRFTSVIGHPPV